MDQPRILDRHSQDGRKEGKEIKKQGAGKANWGSYKDEVEAKEGKEEEKGEAKEEAKEEEEVQVLGLKEYREQNKKRSLLNLDNS